MVTIKYRGKKYMEVLSRVDFHEYVDGCGRVWMVSDDFRYRARAEY